MPTMEIDRAMRELGQVKRELVSQVSENDGLRRQVRELQGDHRRMVGRLLETTGQIQRLEGIVTACEYVLRKVWQENYYVPVMRNEALDAIKMIDELLSDNARLEGK
jgi:hypothetical protein